MRAGIVVEVTPEARVRLARIVGDRNTPQKHSALVLVILATADDCGTLEIVRRSGLSKPVVWRWQERFMHEGVDGLLRDKTRPPGKRPLPSETVRAGRQSDARRTARRDDALDGPGPGRGHRREPALRAT